MADTLPEESYKLSIHGVAILTNFGSRALAGNLDKSHVFVHQVLLPYGSNNAQCMTEGSQRFLLATEGTTACWGINEILNEISAPSPFRP